MQKTGRRGLQVEIRRAVCSFLTHSYQPSDLQGLPLLQKLVCMRLTAKRRTQRLTNGQGAACTPFTGQCHKGAGILMREHVLQTVGLQYTAQPAHDSDSEGSELEGGYSDEEWLEDEVQVENEEVASPTEFTHLM